MRQARLAAAAPILIASLLAFATTGCSLLFVNAPPANAEPRPRGALPIDCTTSNALPVVDTVIGALSGVGTMVISTSTESAWNAAHPGLDQKTEIGIGLSELVLFGASAIYGYVTVDRCERLQPPSDGATPQEAEAK